MIAERMLAAQIVRPARGGMKRHVEELISRSEHTRHLLFAPPALLDEVQSRRLPDLAALFPVTISPNPNFLRDRFLASRLAKQMRDSRAEIVHAHGLRGAMVGVTAARIAGLPVVVTLHNLPPLGGLRKTLAQRSLQKADAVLTVSGAISERLKGYGLPKPPRVIPNGVDRADYSRLVYCDALRQEFHLSAKAKIVLGVARLEPEKGMTLLGGAYAQIRGRAGETVLVILGEGRQHGTLLRFAETREDVFLPGFSGDVRSWLQCADLVVIPSRSEGQSLVALEAMASETPVIASRIGGLPETLGEEMDEALFPAEDVKALTETMIRFLNDTRLRDKHRALGRERVRTHYDLQTQVQKVEAVYAELRRKSA